VTLPVVWIPEAHADLREARAWYQEIRPELGERFTLAVDATVGAIAKNPLQFPVVYRHGGALGYGAFPTEYSSRFKKIGLWCWPASTAGAIRNTGNRAEEFASRPNCQEPWNPTFAQNAKVGHATANTRVLPLW
jgi:hypothetical protein